MDKKKIVLCDTGILFDLLRDVPDTIQELDFLGYKRLALSTVTIGETYYGKDFNFIEGLKLYNPKVFK
jgi:predicted nucleic acid-binding protein